jgi:hypothetical protein
VKPRSILLLVTLFIPSIAWGKRLPPPVVRPVVFNGVEYSAHGDGENAWITATQITTRKEEWTAKVFRVHTHWWKGEIDNQWIFISYLKVEPNALAIKDERGRCYLLDLNTRRVKRDRCHTAPTAHIGIEVHDPSGAPIPKAHVEVVDVSIKSVDILEADDNGKVSIDLSVGSYEVTAAFPAFRTAKKRIDVQDTKGHTVTLVLDVAQSGPVAFVRDRHHEND